MKVYENDIPFEAAISKLEEYVKRAPSFQLEKEPVWKHTIALIVFQEYIGDNASIDKRDKLNTMSLAVTIESIRRFGIGRVVVVGMQQRDEKLAKDAFRFLDPTNADAGGKVGPMEVAFAKGSSQVVDGNVPKSALLGLREAFEIANQGDQSPEQKAHLRAWLGDSQPPKYWEYVYLTEQDNILQHRPSSLLKLRDEVNRGSVLLPHRLQPIPHANDVGGALRRESYLPKTGGFSEVIELNGQTDTCCDDNWGPDRSPGKTNFPDCGKPWYACEFGNPELPVESRAHERLEVYKLIKLQQGTGITLLAGTAQGRRCTPTKNSMGCIAKE